MKRTFLALLVLAISSPVFAKKDCTTEPKSKWMSEKDFKEMVIKKGYQITKFKQPGNCYEIYGKNAEGKGVEVYFNPVNGEIVKSEIDD